jgi:hypothetical protein
MFKQSVALITIAFLIGLIPHLIGGCYKGFKTAICESHTLEQTPHTYPPAKTPYALLVSTNIVSQHCPCGFCDNARGIRVPEHIGVIGYDLRIEVSTNYLPIVYK